MPPPPRRCRRCPQSRNLHRAGQEDSRASEERLSAGNFSLKGCLDMSLWTTDKQGSPDTTAWAAALCQPLTTVPSARQPPEYYPGPPPPPLLLLLILGQQVLPQQQRVPVVG